VQGNKENQEISVVGRLLSLEALVFLMGVVSLVYGLATAGVSETIIGALILIAAVFFGGWLRRMKRNERRIKGEQQ
jgi:Flp pilus assembly protein TadB